MGHEHERSSKRHRSPTRVRGRELADPLTSNPQSRDGTIENHVLTSEVRTYPNWIAQRLFPPRNKKFLGETKWSDSLATQSAVISRGWEFAA
jgi:hypothetical protein